MRRTRSNSFQPGGALPTYRAELGMFDPTKTASVAYQTSRQGTNVLVEAVKGVDVFDPAQHIETLQAARKHHVKTKEETYQSILNSILMQFTPEYCASLCTSPSTDTMKG